MEFQEMPFRDEEDLREYPPGDPFLEQLGVFDEAIGALQFGDAVAESVVTMDKATRNHLWRNLMIERTTYELETLNRWYTKRELKTIKGVSGG